MRIRLLLTLLLCAVLPSLAATGLKGTVVDARSGKPVADANVMIEGQQVFVVSGADGRFTISNAEPGSARLTIIAYGYDDFNEDVEIFSGVVRELGECRLTPQFDGAYMSTDDSANNDDTDYLSDDESMSQAIGTIQSANDNVFYQTSNYNFSVVRFRLRGYDPTWTSGYINGFNFNDAMRGRFNYSGLGGMTSSAILNKTVDVGI